MSKFQTGDRVVVASMPASGKVVEGQVGTVLEDSTSPWIRFDRLTCRGYANCDSLVGWKDGYMECLPNHYLEQYDSSAESALCTSSIG